MYIVHRVCLMSMKAWLLGLSGTTCLPSKLNQSFYLIDFSLLGYSEDELAKLIGSHWTMKVWVDGTAYGGHVICQEFPQYNYLEVFNEAVEKEVNHPLFGGKAKVSLQSS